MPPPPPPSSSPIAPLTSRTKLGRSVAALQGSPIWLTLASGVEYHLLSLLASLGVFSVPAVVLVVWAPVLTRVVRVQVAIAPCDLRWRSHPEHSHCLQWNYWCQAAHPFRCTSSSISLESVSDIRRSTIGLSPRRIWVQPRQVLCSFADGDCVVLVRLLPLSPAFHTFPDGRHFAVPHRFSINTYQGGTGIKQVRWLSPTLALYGY